MLFGCQPFIQDAAAFALSRDFEECALMRQPPWKQRGRRTVEILEHSATIRAPMPEGGMFVFADVRATGMTGEAFALGLLAEENVAVMPGESFGAAGAGHVRISLTAPLDILEPADRRHGRLRRPPGPRCLGKTAVLATTLRICYVITSQWRNLVNTPICKRLLAATALAVGLGAAPALAEIKVAATIKPVHSLVAAVMAGIGEPALLLDGAASPHVTALRPSQAQIIENSDVVFAVGEGLEAFLHRTDGERRRHEDRRTGRSARHRTARLSRE
jgi:hypothetical protein